MNNSFLSLIFITLFNVELISGRRPLLLISLDGFRWDYWNRQTLPNLQKLRNEGSSADFVMNAFVTITFPCHTTIVTGIMLHFLLERTH